MVNQDSFTPQEYAKMVGMFPDPPQNPLPTGGYMDAGFDWVVHQAEGDDDDNYEKLLEQIEEKQEEIRYHEQMLDVAGYGRTELMELEALKEELADLESLAFGAEGEQKFIILYSLTDVNKGKVVERGEYPVTASNEREAIRGEIRRWKEAGLNDDEFDVQIKPLEAKRGINVPLQKHKGGYENFHYNCPYCKEELTIMGDGWESIVAVCENGNKGCHGLKIPRQYLENYLLYDWHINEGKSAETFEANAGQFPFTFKPIEYYLEKTDDVYVVRSHPSGNAIMELNDAYNDMAAESVVRRLNQITDNQTHQYLQQITNGQNPQIPQYSLRKAKTKTGNSVIMYDESPVAELSVHYNRFQGIFADSVIKDLNRDLENNINGLLQFVTNKVGSGYMKDIGMNRAETFGAEAQPISDEGEFLVIRNDMGKTKGFIEMEEDLEDDSIEMEISDDEMEEIAEITLDAEFSAQGRHTNKEVLYVKQMKEQFFDKRNAYEMYDERTHDYGYFTSKNSAVKDAEKSKAFYESKGYYVELIQGNNGIIYVKTTLNKDISIDTSILISYTPIKKLGAETATYEPSQEPDMEAPATEPTNANFDTEFIKPSRDWFSLALGTAAVVIGGSLFLQNRGVFKADGDGTETAPSLVAHPSTGDLLPADYEEMVVESTGYAVPVIPVSLDPSFMGSRFHALPTDRTVESNEPGIGAHTDVAMTRDTNYREPEQTMVTEPPFAYKFNAEKKLSLLDRIKAFFMGHKDVKEANSITGQTPYFGVGFEPKNPQTRVIKETRPISLDPSTAPYLPTNLSGYTGQSYTPPSVYSDMMQIGVTGQTPSFVSSQSSIGENRAGSRPVATSDSLQSVHGNLSAGVNQSYTDGSKTMSLSQWSIEYDVSQISDSEAFAVSRSSGERTMIRRV